MTAVLSGVAGALRLNAIKAEVDPHRSGTSDALRDFHQLRRFDMDVDLYGLDTAAQVLRVSRSAARAFEVERRDLLRATTRAMRGWAS